MIAALLKKLGLSVPTPFLPPDEPGPEPATSDWDVGQTIRRADRQLRRVEAHTDQARRVAKSWEDLFTRDPR